ncbi:MULTISPECIES: hypothetical protein [Mesorhizobium]|uniref:hypothetical protein n=1 Tax=Mesorhizobium TaxID=68287 RepID=UPI0007ECB30D|nr:MULTISPECIES: hypothetical protein [Mesorhizobium]ARP67213.1 hypothetical protein A9K65_030620 [Mesorhizobium sp. WSM1497]MCA0002798.1 hypothetical protein [Mesorhizobium sp. B264B2A]MCA0009051.1 hypothetical protein [Mesorhizobium sp. B264B1B]MCA0014552.1 hypothetical protein [Mesorhizobium sp. B294B1A1]MCA0018191.1 hypothetical protein [Mesorhizobium sp. B264B1A]
MPLLFCNIAWMNHYAGRDPNDPPKGGGGFPVLEGFCGEELNFVACEDGYVYGHFETIKGEEDRQVNIQRLGAGPEDDFLDGVDIVWTAPTQGSDPRCVVGWYRNARIYRHRQKFNGQFPSVRHVEDEITSFRVKARIKDVRLLPSSERRMKLERGPGWSGQVSWWYAEDTKNRNARDFVRSVRKLLEGERETRRPSSATRRKRRAGEAASNAYSRYVEKYEAVVHPRHNRLQRRFEAYLKDRFPGVTFPATFCDDLRYVADKRDEVMVEIKPTEPSTLRFAIRTAIGQLLDYRQHQRWNGKQLIVVETEVTNADDRALAFDNGFGLAWPIKDGGFAFAWPPKRRQAVI